MSRDPDTVMTLTLNADSLAIIGLLVRQITHSSCTADARLGFKVVKPKRYRHEAANICQIDEARRLPLPYLRGVRSRSCGSRVGSLPSNVSYYGVLRTKSEDAAILGWVVQPREH